MLPDPIEFINEPQKFLAQYKNTDQYKEGHQEGFFVGLNEAKVRFHQAMDSCIMGDNSKHFINKAYKAMFGEEYSKINAKDDQ